ncbi:MAG: hypothetical protein BGO63_10495 [Candidatus Accumulibacter sp. 66-26]|nr:PRTRC system protein C [Accumulibacter sp.]OJW51552.1 MAG: hypothetical protein BGO63_10495 [Candidatus Accumulibacter sp. 66-26]
MSHLQVETIERRFMHGGRTLPDPDPSMSPDDVRAFYSAIHPELLNAVVTGGEFTGQIQVFEFRRAVGDKG